MWPHIVHSEALHVQASKNASKMSVFEGSMLNFFRLRRLGGDPPDPPARATRARAGKTTFLISYGNLPT